MGYSGSLVVCVGWWLRGFDEAIFPGSMRETHSNFENHSPSDGRGLGNHVFSRMVSEGWIEFGNKKKHPIPSPIDVFTQHSARERTIRRGNHLQLRSSRRGRANANAGSGNQPKEESGKCKEAAEVCPKRECPAINQVLLVPSKTKKEVNTRAFIHVKKIKSLFSLFPSTPLPCAVLPMCPRHVDGRDLAGIKRQRQLSHLMQARPHQP